MSRNREYNWHMQNNHRFFFPLLLAILLVLTACTPDSSLPKIGKEIQVAGGSYYKVSPLELNSLLENKDFLLVNVHVPFEGDLPQTDLSIPYDTIAQNLDQLPADKDAKIVLYCRSGRMSEIAAAEMVRLGYSNILELDGGFLAWEAAGLEIER